MHLIELNASASIALHLTTTCIHLPPAILIICRLICARNERERKEVNEELVVKTLCMQLLRESKLIDELMATMSLFVHLSLNVYVSGLLSLTLIVAFAFEAGRNEHFCWLREEKEEEECTGERGEENNSRLVDADADA